MVHRPLGRTGFRLSPVGFGAFKIGRNQGIKYAHEYALPDEREVDHLLNGVLDLGINYIDTAPAYGVSEERIGKSLAHRKSEFVLSTKVGETFDNGKSHFDYSASAVRQSLARSCKRLSMEVLDLVFVHSNGDDLQVIQHSDVVETLCELKNQGVIRAIGFSGKTVEGAHTAIADGWADAIMVEYHINDRSHESVIAEATQRGVGVIVKKGLASGHLDPHAAIRFVLSHASVASMVIGGLNLDHMRANVAAARQLD